MPAPLFLPQATIADTGQAESLLELAYLMAAVDGRLADEELEIFGQVANVVLGERVSDGDFGALLDRFAGRIERTEIEARVREIATTLPPELREDAFRVAMGVALVDRDPDLHEDQLMGILFEALGLEEARADAIAAEVRAAFS